MPPHQVLFCPFCRESFEGRQSCPEHDLALVAFDKLGPDPLEPANMPEVIDQTPLELFDPSFGRGYVAVGALLTALSLIIELVRGVGGSRGLRAHQVAITIPSLWTLALVSFTLLFVLHRRRTPAAMRSVRVLVPALAVVPPATVAWAFYRLHHGAAVWAGVGHKIGLDPGPAVYVVGLAAVLVFYGGLQLGVLKTQQGTRL